MPKTYSQKAKRQRAMNKARPKKVSLSHRHHSDTHADTCPTKDIIAGLIHISFNQSKGQSQNGYKNVIVPLTPLVTSRCFNH